MNDDSTELPEPHRVIRVTVPDSPVSQMADVEAWHARESYPDIRPRGPWFGLAEQELDSRWRLLATDDWEPQHCRDALATVCRMRCKDAEQAGDAPLAEAWRVGYRRMDREPIDELHVLDYRFRVIRGDYFARIGPSGPEPPRTTDPDPEGLGANRRLLDRTHGFLLDPTAPTGMSEGILKMDFSQLIYPDSLPARVHADSVAAVYSHPGGVLLPAVFCLFERDGKRWAPHFSTHDTPQGAREGLATSIGGMLPPEMNHDDETRPEFPAAIRRTLARREGYLAPGADGLTAEQLNLLDEAITHLQRDRPVDFDVLGHHYRVVRLERFVRMGPDGPEPPRPSDPEDALPIEVQAERDRAAGLVPDSEAGGQE